MAVDPNTGQTQIPIQAGQSLAGYIDPSAFGAYQGGQAQLDMQGQLAHALMSQGYIPNSGFGGALTQAIQGFMGMKMLRDMQDKQQGLYQQYAQALQDAMKAQRQAKREDQTFTTDEEVRKANAVAQGAEDIKLKNAEQEGKNAASAAALKAQAELPSQMALEKQKGGYQLAAAEIGANATKGRAYQVQDANGNTTMVALQPDGSFKQVYQTTTPGGGKLTPAQTVLNSADEQALKEFTTRQSSAKQLQGNLVGFVSKYTGLDPAKVQAMSPEDMAKAVRSVPYSTAAGMAINPQYGGIDAIASDIGINAAGTKRASPTDAIIAAEQKNTVSRYNTPEKNADILLNHFHDIQGLAAQQQKVSDQIASRQSPGSGRIPAAENGPQNPAPQQQIPQYSQAQILEELKRRGEIMQ